MLHCQAVPYELCQLMFFLGLLKTAEDAAALALPIFVASQSVLAPGSWKLSGWAPLNHADEAPYGGT